MFVGDVFENDPAMQQVKSLLLDYFRGRQVGRHTCAAAGVKRCSCCHCCYAASASARRVGVAWMVCCWPVKRALLVGWARVGPAVLSLPQPRPSPAVSKQVDNINLKGLDRVIMVTQHPESKRVLFRQYSVRYKKSGGWPRGLLISVTTPPRHAELCCPGGCRVPGMLEV